MSLPEFRKPPVVETVLGLQFEKLTRFRNAHWGIFWSELGAEWPLVSETGALDPHKEVFETAQLFVEKFQRVKVTQDLSIRLQIKNMLLNRMIQVQSNRFHYNWLGESGTEDYPRYQAVLPEFEKYLEKFQDFVFRISTCEEEVKPNQWEVTYVNHIPRGTVWSSPNDWASVFSCDVTAGELSGLGLETIDSSWRYEIPPQRGRLYFQLQHGKKQEQEILILRLTARGPIPEAGYRAGLDLGHETIVTAFRDLTSRRAHEYWELIDGN